MLKLFLHTTKSNAINSLVYGKIILNGEPIFRIQTTNSLELYQTSPLEFSLNTTWGRKVFEIKKVADGILLQPDIYGSLPIYAYNHRESLYIANSFGDLLTLIPSNEYPKLNKQNIIQFLMKEPPNNGETILDNVQVYGGDSQLIWDGVKQKRIFYEHQHQNMSSSMNIDDIFQKNLEWAKKYKENEIGVTLSGGVDSAVVWAGLCRMGIKPIALSIIYPHSMGVRQHNKLRQLINIADSKLVTIKPKNYSFDYNKIDPYKSLYAKLNKRLANKAKRLGIKIVLTGLGGDQLASNAGYDGRGFSFKKVLPKFITQLAVNDYQSLPKYPKANQKRLIPKTALNAAGITGELGFEHKLWSENPLCYPDFWRWTSSLPREWGHNKNGLRGYLKEFGATEISESTLNEDYRDIYIDGIKHLCISESLTNLVSHSILEKWLLIDTKYLLEFLKQEFNGYSPDMQYIISVYELEKFLQWYYNIKLKGVDNFYDFTRI